MKSSRTYIELGLGQEYLTNREKLVLRDIYNNDTTTLITFMYQPQAFRTIARELNIKKDGAIPNYMNMYDYFQGIYNEEIDRKSNTAQDSRVLADDIVLTPVDENHVDGKKDNAIKVRVQITPGTYQEINRIEFYDELGNISQIDIYDWKGFLSSTTYYDNDGYKTQELYYDLDGHVVIEKNLFHDKEHNEDYIRMITLKKNGHDLVFRSDLDLFDYFLSEVYSDELISIDIETFELLQSFHNAGYPSYLLTTDPVIKDEITGNYVDSDDVKSVKMSEGKFYVFSESQKKRLMHDYQDNIEVLDYHDFMLDVERLNEEHRIDDTKRLLYSGTVTKEDRVELLIGSMKKIHNAGFTIMNQSQYDIYNHFLNGLTENENTVNVGLQSWIGNWHPSVIDIYDRSDVFVYAGDEAVTNEMLLAKELGLSIVAFDNDVIIKDDSIMIVPDNDIDSYSKLINKEDANVNL